MACTGFNFTICAATLSISLSKILFFIISNLVLTAFGDTLFAMWFEDGFINFEKYLDNPDKSEYFPQLQ